jgi:hypothetical protein
MLARPTGFEPVTSAFGGQQVSINYYKISVYWILFVPLLSRLSLRSATFGSPATWSELGNPKPRLGASAEDYRRHAGGGGGHAHTRGGQDARPEAGCAADRAE